MKLYWEFLQDACLDWTRVNLEKLADFILWLREPEPRAISMRSQEARRSERTINKILSAVYGFYDFHHRLGNVEDLNAYGYRFLKNRRYKPFLHHITKGKETRSRLLKLKEPKRKVETFTQAEVKQLIDACDTTRDKFLLCLLYESGMRIGQALGLRHEDVRSWDNEIDIIYRSNCPSPEKVDIPEALRTEENDSMSPQPRRVLTDEQKAEAVRIVAPSGQPIRPIAPEMGRTESTLRNWVKPPRLTRQPL